MRNTMRRVRAWLTEQWRYLSPVGWALLALAVVIAVAVTVSTVTANAREGEPSAAEAAFEARWKDVPASVDRAAAERAAMYGDGYLWADECRTKLYAGGRVVDVDPTWLSAGKGAAITGTRMWGCGGDYVPDAKPVRESPAVVIPRVEADADAAARQGFPYLWQTVQGQRTYLVLEVPAVGTFAIERKVVDRPHQEIPPQGQWVPPISDVERELR